MLSLCLICCQRQQNSVQRKSHSTPSFFQETTEPIWFQCRAYSVSRRGSEPKNLGRWISRQVLLQKNRSRRKQSTWFSKREVRADTADQVQAGHSSLALLNLPSLGKVQPTAVLLICLPSQNLSVLNKMGERKMEWAQHCITSGFQGISCIQNAQHFHCSSKLWASMLHHWSPAFSSTRLGDTVVFLLRVPCPVLLAL